MATTRPGEPDPNLPQTITVGCERSMQFVINPLVTHVRAHRQSALDFVVDQFKRRRVTTIGEQHGAQFSSSGENVCVRMFISDLIQALHADPECRFRYFVVELDEAALVQRIGHDWQGIRTINPKASWLAESLGFHGAFREIFRAVARIPANELEVVGIDHRVGRLSYDQAPHLEQQLHGDDLTQAPNETPERFQQRRARIIDERQREYTELSRERDTGAAENFERKVLDRLGDDRVLIYYGASHLREGRIEPGGDHHRGFTNSSFIRQIIERDNGLRAEDIYSVCSVFPGAARDHRSVSARELRREIDDEIQLLRIFDVLRAEFPDDHSLGFDLDEAQWALRPIDRSASYRLGDWFDGCVYFRDLLSWNGQTQPPADSGTEAFPHPELSITSVIPMRASPGNTIFIYGYVLTPNTQVSVLTRGASGESQFPCSDVACINENVIRATVPMPGSFPVSGQEATIRLFRPGAPPADEPVELRSAFRYVIR